MYDPTPQMDEGLPPRPLVVSIEELIKEAPDLVADIKTFHPVKSAQLVASLQLEPTLLGNNLRIDALVQLCLSFGAGKRRPSEKTIGRWFRRLGDTHASRYEDPPEGLFVGLIRSSRGDFMVLEGSWECPTFYLQRFVDIIEKTSDEGNIVPFKEAIYGALRMSDAICKRAQLSRYEAGARFGANELSNSILRQMRRRSLALTFSKSELEKIGVDPVLTSAFVRRPEAYQTLPREPVGGSGLDRFPFVSTQLGLTCLLPNAISLSIRRLIIETALDSENEDELLKSLQTSYTEHFRQMPMLGLPGELPISMTPCGFGGIGEAGCRVDENHFLQFIFVGDNFEGYHSSALGGIGPDQSKKMAELIGRLVEQFSSSVRDGFPSAKGITLIVGCGYGRAQLISFDREAKTDWTIEHISAPDLDTLCWLSDFHALDLWRLGDLQSKLAEMDVTLMNANGLLNLAAWGRMLDGHLVPHGEIPDQFATSDGPLLIPLPTNCLKALREKAANDWDPRVIERFDGCYAYVRHPSPASHPDPQRTMLYADEDFGTGGRLSAVYRSCSRLWWMSVDGGSTSERQSLFRHWEMLCMWLVRIAPALDELLPNRSFQIIHLAYQFPAAISMETRSPRPEQSNAPSDDIDVNVDAANRIVKIVAGHSFEAAQNSPTNIAEKALVDATVLGIIELTDLVLTTEIETDLLRKIVPNDQARHLHAFAAREFRHFVSVPYPATITIIDQQDDALLKLGVGWRERKPSEGHEIRGITECTAYLNKTVASVEREFCKLIAQFDRKQLCKYAIGLHEKASFERMKWNATTGARLAIHDDKKGVVEEINHKAYELNGVTATTRLILEAALCESPISGGQTPGELDISRLMATAAFVFNTGGASDAIRWGAIDDLIHVTPLGDIHMNYAGFVDRIVQPYSDDGQALRIKDDAKRYPELYEEVSVTPGTGDLEPAFLEAWRAEMGTDILNYRAFIDCLEDIGIERSLGVFEMKRSELIAINNEDRDLTIIASENIVQHLETVPRESWHVTPDGFRPRDRQPWKYRRRLSVLSRPLLALSDATDPTILIAPGLVREAFSVLVRGYGEGRYGPDACRALAMKKWVGRAVDRRGAAFTQKVATKLQGLGWECETEVKLTKILGRALPEDFGDIDVLAWHAITGRVLLIECKDLQHQKTYGEVAEQLNDFKGKFRKNGKKDNLLKHLDRIQLLESEVGGLAKYLRLSVLPKISGSLVFRHPVPMRHAYDQMSIQIDLWLFDELDKVKP